MDLKISYGPWETIFSGKLYTHEVEVLMNPEKYFITIIYDIKDGRKTGALIEGHKALVAKGHMGSFIQTLPKRSMGITKTNGDKTTKMFFISFNPIYVDFKQEDFVRKIDNEIKKSFSNIETIIDLAKTSSLILNETSMSPETEYAPILGDPFMARSLLSGLKKTAMELIDFSSAGQITNDNIIQLGLNKKREIIKEEIKNLYRTIIIGNTNIEINYANYILAENFLLEKQSTIIFDSTNYFEGLEKSSKNDRILKEELVAYEPAGFPVKKFKAKDNIKLSFDSINFEIIFDLLKIKDNDLKKIISNYNGLYSTPQELIDQISTIQELSEYKKLKLERIIRIIDKTYENFFGTNTQISELTKKWAGNLGKATILNIKELTKEEKIIFINTILKELLVEIKNTNEKNIIIII
ncbi:MAG: hypothetical protein PHX27_04030, partial [Candidatus ainarchaeum sp.]|nr:hypothetical protein [Candidatus ainarchaeum sp.]